MDRPREVLWDLSMGISMDVYRREMRLNFLAIDGRKGPIYGQNSYGNSYRTINNVNINKSVIYISCVDFLYNFRYLAYRLYTRLEKFRLKGINLSYL